MNGTKFTVDFEWKCKCHNADPKMFHLINKANKIELLCLICEVKFEVALSFKEIT